jgi:hypothetical protein
MVPWWRMSVKRIGWDRWPFLGSRGWHPHPFRPVGVLYLWRVVIVLVW